MSGQIDNSDAGIVQRIEGLLSPQNERRKQTPQMQDDASVPQEALDDEDNAPSLEEDGLDQGDEGDLESQSDDSPDDEGSTEDEGTASDEDGEDDLDLNSKVTVTIDGKSEEVSLKEVIDGYQRTVDYTRKTQVLAEERRAVQQEKEAVVQERSTYAQLLPALMQQIQASLPQQPDWDRLYNEDPLEYVRQKDIWNENTTKLNALADEQRRLIAFQQQEYVNQQKQIVAEGFKKLPDLVPRWKDPEQYKKDMPLLRGYAKKLGYSDEEINQAYDPRAIAALDKARRYDELMERQKKLRPTITAEPPRPGTARRAGPPPNKVIRAKQRLRQTGRDNDAVAAITAVLEREKR